MVARLNPGQSRGSPKLEAQVKFEISFLREIHSKTARRSVDAVRG